MFGGVVVFATCLHITAVVDTFPVNPALCGVNNEWCSPLSGFVSWHDRKPKGWFVNDWVNRSDPLASSETLNHLLSGLKLGSYRYPGGSIGNYWNWTSNNLSPAASTAYYQEVALQIATSFPPGSFGVERFDAMAKAANADNVLALDVSTAGPDASIPAKVVSQLGINRANSFEIGNEVYDPRQGPKPHGFLTAQEYLNTSSELIEAVHKTGARAAVPAAPCPLFYPQDSDCWGGINGRYHQWNRNLSATCTNSDCPFDAIVGHNYVMGVEVLKQFPAADMLSVYLAVPQVTTQFGADNIRRNYPHGIELWMTEYNTMYSDVWRGAADASAPEAAAFLNQTENSNAHAVHVAGYVMAAMSNGDVIKMMHYHSFLEGAQPTFFGSNGTGDQQPGFAVSAINNTGTYISPVAQLLSMVANLLREPNATMQSLPQSPSAPTLSFTFEAGGLGSDPVYCIHATAICAGKNGSGTILAVNRCPQAASVNLTSGCAIGGGWTGVDVFAATLSHPGRTWSGTTGPLPWGPMTPDHTLGGSGYIVSVPPHSLVVISQ